MSEYDDGVDIYDFSWRTMNRTMVEAESSGFSSAVHKAAQKVRDLCISNSYDETANEFNNVCRNLLGRNSWIQQYYYANEKTFAPYMKNDSRPSGFYDMSGEDQIAFDYGLKCQKDASACCKPLDQLQLLMITVPLKSTFRLVRATINLDDAGFDEPLYKQIDDDVREIAVFVNKNWDSFERISNSASERFYKENKGRMSPSDLQAGYRKARLRDYKTTFEAYCVKASKDFKCNDYCTFSMDLNYYACMLVIDEYMKDVAEIVKSDFGEKLENSIKESQKLAAVFNSRMAKCKEDAFIMSMTAAETLNYAIGEFCQLGLDIFNNYKSLISAAPYCFMKKLPSSDSLNSKYGLKPMSGDPLSEGTHYAPLISSAASALTQHCRDFVYSHGRKDMM